MTDSKPLIELFSLKGRKAVITGGASGIGRAIAERFAEAGADLVLVDVNEVGMAEVARTLSGKFGVNVSAKKVDLMKKPEIDNLWKELETLPPDILVNNAGIYEFKDFLEVDEAFLERTLSVNLKSAFYMCQHFIRTRGEKGGVIVNVSSIESVLHLVKGLIHYGVSKIGLVAMTRALAREYGEKGFRVNAVMPGGIHTPGTDKVRNEAIKKLRIGFFITGLQFISRVPLKRLGEPDEVAKVVLFLATDMASYVNGAVITVDGGFLTD
ncbi:MAG: SDR family oxidoreductase [Candidatus Caldarchaeum sp.]|nr:SDR family oxidoreductase [Candidatus Caldarchaeum sp.]MDW8435537.1 SDR family NAD(P)-dependent oxidoreductase [Candidatus Caldarchaeum sp.]